MKQRLLIILLCLSTYTTTQAKEYTPSDVFSEALLLEQDIKRWRVIEGKSHLWVTVAVETNYQPRHVYQKAIEILEKINRYRVNIIEAGAIPVDYVAGREITPNEVYTEVYRAHEEMLAMLQILGIFVDNNDLEKQKVTGKTPSDVYAKLKEISLALDQSLGLRGITPSDVYNRSQQIVALAKFLRSSQNFPISMPKVIVTANKFPNHSLAAVQALIAKINKIEQNLSMDPVRIIDLPKRVINPSDVYDAMGIVLAELQRIQHHLGLERYISQGKNIQGKNIQGKDIDDAIYNTNLAIALLPNFSDKVKLQRYNPKLLVKDPNDIYSLTHYLLGELYKYCRIKGINLPAQRQPVVAELQPRHVYTKALEVLDMIIQVRENQGMGQSALTPYPLRHITTQAVFTLSLRIDEFLNIIFKHSQMMSKTWQTSEKIEYFQDKTPSDVYINMWKISSMLETIMGNQGFNLNHLFQRADRLEKNIDILTAHLVSVLPIKIKYRDQNIAKQQNNKFSKKIEFDDLLQQTLQIKKIISALRKQQGMSTDARLTPAAKHKIDAQDIYSDIWKIEADLSEFKILLGIDKHPIALLRGTDHLPTDVYQKLLIVEKKLILFTHYLLDAKHKDFK